MRVECESSTPTPQPLFKEQLAGHHWKEEKMKKKRKERIKKEKRDSVKKGENKE